MQKTAGKFIWNYLQKFKFVLAGICLSALAARGISQAGSYVMAKIFSFAGASFDNPVYYETLLKLLLLCCGLELFGHLFQTMSIWFGCRLIPFIRSIVIKDVFEYVNRHSISYFVNEMTGNISNKFNQLQNGMVEFFMQSGNILSDCQFGHLGMDELGFRSNNNCVGLFDVFCWTAFRT